MLCPDGYAIPDDPSSDRNWFINKTLSECAVSCVDPPYFTKEESETMNTVKIVSLIIGGLCTFSVLTCWLLDWTKRGKVFEVTSGIVLGFGFVFMLLTELFGDKKLYCFNNTIPIEGTDGLSLCVIKGALRMYFVLYFSVAFCFQSFEIFRRVVLGFTKKPDKQLYVATILIIPLIFTCIGLSEGIYGSRMGTRMCAVGRHEDSSAVAHYISLPLFCFVFVGFICTFGIILKLIALMRKLGIRDSASSWDGAALTITSLKFFVFSASYSVTFFLIRFVMLPSEAERQQIGVDYGLCALEYFDGTSGSHFAACGRVPRRTRSFLVQCLIMVWVTFTFGLFFLIVNVEGFISVLKKLKHVLTKVTPLGPYLDPRYNSLAVTATSGCAIPESMLQGRNYRFASRILSFSTRGEHDPSHPTDDTGGTSFVMNMGSIPSNQTDSKLASTNSEDHANSSIASIPKTPCREEPLVLHDEEAGGYQNDEDDSS